MKRKLLVLLCLMGGLLLPVVGEHVPCKGEVTVISPQKTKIATHPVEKPSGGISLFRMEWKR